MCVDVIMYRVGFCISKNSATLIILNWCDNLYVFDRISLVQTLTTLSLSAETNILAYFRSRTLEMQVIALLCLPIN
jgi:hypothetical protein